MAKDKKPVPKDERPEFKYGVKDLTKEAGLVNDQATRVQLRALNVPTVGGVYGWNNMNDLKEVAKKILERKRAPKHEVPKTPKGVAKVGAEPKAKKADADAKPKAEAKPKTEPKPKKTEGDAKPKAEAKPAKKAA